MPLVLCDPGGAIEEQSNPVEEKSDPTRVDIIAVPTIGVDPRRTFKYPGRPGSNDKWESLYKGTRAARVYLYQTVKPTATNYVNLSLKITNYGVSTSVDLRDDSIEHYALDLLQCLSNTSNIGKRPLHFSGHGVGGLVIKKALVLAQSSSKESYRRIAEACFSVAFFGVPHFGSTVLSADEYKFGIRNLMNMESPLSSDIRKELSTRNLRSLQELNEKFASFALGLMKIWSFVEVKKTTLEVLSGNPGEGETVETVWRHIVDPRSATLSSTAIRVGSEQVIELSCDHVRLPSFGNNIHSMELLGYIDELRTLIEDLVLNGQRDPSWVEKLIHVDVHQFYEEKEKSESSLIKIWSEAPLLSTLLQRGPAACLRDGIDDFESLYPVINEDESTLSTIESSIPKIVIIPPEQTQFTRRSNSSVQTPMITVEDVDDTDQGAPEKEILPRTPAPRSITWQGNDKNAVVSIQEELPQKSNGQSTIATHREEEVFSDRTAMYAGDALLPRNWYPLIRETEEIIRQKVLQPPEPSQNLFRWIHVPTNNMLFVPRVFQAIGKEHEAPFYHSKLLDARVWDSKQNLPRHDSPHARFMHPSCQSFLPTITDDPKPPSSPHGPQLAVYFPYLHWDTFASLMNRSAVIERRMKQAQPFPIPRDIADGPSIENKLIWQYLNNHANLPLHHRRSLDQFGYPTLSSTSHRDIDQVLYKRTRSELDQDGRNIGDKRPFMPHFMRLLNRERIRDRRERNRKQQKGPRLERDNRAKAISPVLDKKAKVLMVDQIWCWVLGSESVVTFFSAKEEDGEDSALRQGDLRTSILNDINGDPRFAKQCWNPFEFAALAICHAAGVLLEKVTDRDLEVFRIFEEYISQLTERQTVSFKEFRDSQADDLDDDKMLRSTNQKDLSALLELCDVEDELSTIQKLFNEQRTALRQMIRSFEEIDHKHRQYELGRSIVWLEETHDRIAGYREQVDMMIDNCRIAQKDYQNLLDMKQKQANVDEAWLARRANKVAATQGRAVMIFTIFTIIFLPLSFFTSLFGMNAREWSGTPKNLSLSTIFILMASISVVVIVVALLIAFNDRIRLLEPLSSCWRWRGRPDVSARSEDLEGGWGRERDGKERDRSGRAERKGVLLGNWRRDGSKRTHVD
ncbi:hypothetical protein K490DRAFT_66386 [Saccharata proteae CBS 121410]|uniref:DUF676 domain-containing protein n=1 Tax=Saccharata proteae CBS 121410 TaxID=1314787 RepID=A0A9P4HVC0_9PEZI|nr:hypothetical protein K490DRAFT_66386 [Saccharata proteae CBS 121410]